MTFKRVRLIVHGRVQGVFYRQTTLEVATKLKIKGYVRNTYQGTVEAVFEGTQESVDQMINWFKTGPSYANVQKVDIIDETEKAKGYESFTIERTK